MTQFLDRSKAPEIKELEQLTIQRLVRTTLPNGVELVVIDAGNEDVSRIDLLFRSGTLHQSRVLQCQLAIGMLRNSTASFSQQTINERLDYFGAWLKPYVALEYSGLSLYCLNKYFADVMPVLASMIKEPLFKNEELQILAGERKQQHIIARNKVNWLAYRAMCNALYGEQHPLARYASPDDFDTLSPEHLFQFHKDHIHARNCVIYLSGKVSDSMLALVEEVWGREYFGTSTRPLAVHLPRPETSLTKRTHIEKEDALQSAVNLGALTIGEKDPDFLDLGVATTLFGGYFGSRLMSNIREDKGYTYGISAFLNPQPGHSQLLITAQTTPESVEPLIGEVYHEIDILQNEIPGADELQMVRNYMLGNICRAYEGPFSLSEAWIGNDFAGLPEDYFESAVRAVKEITPEQIRDLANRYFCKENLIEVVAGKKTKG